MDNKRIFTSNKKLNLGLLVTTLLGLNSVSYAQLTHTVEFYGDQSQTSCNANSPATVNWLNITPEMLDPAYRTRTTNTTYQSSYPLGNTAGAGKELYDALNNNGIKLYKYSTSSSEWEDVLTYKNNQYYEFSLPHSALINNQVKLCYPNDIDANNLPLTIHITDIFAQTAGVPVNHSEWVFSASQEPEFSILGSASTFRKQYYASNHDTGLRVSIVNAALINTIGFSNSGVDFRINPSNNAIEIVGDQAINGANGSAAFVATTTISAKTDIIPSLSYSQAFTLTFMGSFTAPVDRVFTGRPQSPLTLRLGSRVNYKIPDNAFAMSRASQAKAVYATDDELPAGMLLNDNGIINGIAKAQSSTKIVKVTVSVGSNTAVNTLYLAVANPTAPEILPAFISHATAPVNEQVVGEPVFGISPGLTGHSVLHLANLGVNVSLSIAGTNSEKFEFATNKVPSGNAQIFSFLLQAKQGTRLFYSEKDSYTISFYAIENDEYFGRPYSSANAYKMTVSVVNNQRAAPTLIGKLPNFTFRGNPRTSFSSITITASIHAYDAQFLTMQITHKPTWLHFNNTLFTLGEGDEVYIEMRGRTPELDASRALQFFDEHAISVSIGTFHLSLSVHGSDPLRDRLIRVNNPDAVSTSFTIFNTRAEIYSKPVSITTYPWTISISSGNPPTTSTIQITSVAAVFGGGSFQANTIEDYNFRGMNSIFFAQGSPLFGNFRANFVDPFNSIHITNSDLFNIVRIGNNYQLSLSAKYRHSGIDFDSIDARAVNRPDPRVPPYQVTVNGTAEWRYHTSAQKKIRFTIATDYQGITNTFVTDEYTIYKDLNIKTRANSLAAITLEVGEEFSYTFPPNAFQSTVLAYQDRLVVVVPSNQASLNWISSSTNESVTRIYGTTPTVTNTYKLKYNVIDKGNITLSVNIPELTIVVVDDKAPKLRLFQNTPLRTRSATSEPRDTGIRIEASDPSGIATISIVTSDFFELNDRKDAINVIPGRFLEWHNTLTVIAVDNDNTSSTARFTLVIPAIEEPPAIVMPTEIYVDEQVNISGRDILLPATINIQDVNNETIAPQVIIDFNNTPFSAADILHYTTIRFGKGIFLNNNTTLNYEERNSYTLTVIARDDQYTQANGLASTAVMTIHVRNVNERPVTSAFNPSGKYQIGTSLYLETSLFFTDPDNSPLAYRIDCNTSYCPQHDPFYTLTNSRSIIKSKVFDTIGTHVVTLAANDFNLDATYIDSVFTISVVAVNPPTLSLLSSVQNANSPIPEARPLANNINTGIQLTVTTGIKADAVGKVPVIVNDSRFSFAHSGNSSIDFTYDLSALASASFDFETENPIVLTAVFTDDKKASATIAMSVNLHDVAERGFVQMGSPRGILEGMSSVAIDTGVTISIVAQAPNPVVSYSDNRFTINESNNALIIKASADIDYETTGDYLTLTISARRANLNDQAMITMRILNKYEVNTTVRLPLQLVAVSSTVSLTIKNDLIRFDGVLRNQSLVWENASDYSWLSLDSNSILTGIPTASTQATLKFAVNDSLRSYKATMVIAAINAMPNRVIKENTRYAYTLPNDAIISANDTFTWVNKPNSLSWLDFDANTRRFTGTASGHGKSTVMISGIHNTQSYTVSFTLAQITELADQVINTNEEFNYTLTNSAIVNRNDTFNWERPTKLNWLSFNSSSLSFTGTPTVNEILTISINVSNDFAPYTISFKVVPVRELANQVIFVDDAFSMRVPDTSLVPNAQTRRVSWLRPTDVSLRAEMAWLNFNETTRTFSGTPTNNGLATLTVSYDTSFGAYRLTAVIGMINRIPDQTVGLNDEFEFILPNNALVNPTSDTISIIKPDALDWLHFNRSSLRFSSNQATQGAVSTVRLAVVNSGDVNVSYETSFKITVDPKSQEYVKAVNNEIAAEIVKVIASKTFNSISDRVTSSPHASSASNGFISDSSLALLDLINSKRDKLNRGESINWRELLNGNQFAIPLGAVPGGPGAAGSKFGIWGTGDVSLLKGGTANSVSYDGQILSTDVGIDYRTNGGSIFGLSYGLYTGDIDYTIHNVLNRETKGKYKLEMDLVQPYVSVDTFADSKVWLAVGVGAGEIESNVQLERNPFDYNADATLLHYGLGISSKVFSFLQTSTEHAHLDLNLNFIGSKLDIDQAVIDNVVLSTVAASTYKNTSFRVGVEYLYETYADDGSSLTPSFEVVLRNDADDSNQGSVQGVELIARLNYLTADRLNFSGHTRYITIPSNDYSEFGGGVNLRLSPGAANLGASFNVEPSYTADNNTNIWDIVSKNDLDELLSTKYNFKVKSELAYGLGYNLGYTGGVITPFGNFNLQNQDQDYGLGFRVNQGEQKRWQLSYHGYSDVAKDNEVKIEYHLTK